MPTQANLSMATPARPARLRYRFKFDAQLQKVATNGRAPHLHQSVPMKLSLASEKFR